MDTRVTRIVTLGLAAVLSLGCSLVTEFDPDKLLDGGGALYSLEANIADPVAVELQDNGNATIQLSLQEPLPDADDATLAELLNMALHLTVVNSDTDVNVDLTQGTRVDAEPSQPGEYQITLNDARDQVTILFRNETVNGLTLRQDGNYEATVEVTQNLIFEVESFVRSVSLTSSP